jgi:ubiquinone/menaquinone biosynthesis C-methylase UbiE
VEFLASLADDGPVLELAIGTGRVALPLAARGLVVESVDASAAMAQRLVLQR